MKEHGDRQPQAGRKTMKALALIWSRPIAAAVTGLLLGATFTRAAEEDFAGVVKRTQAE